MVPNIIEFALSGDYLNVRLYPRQATLLKLIFGAVELLTDYDRGVLAQWTAGFSARPRRRHRGVPGSVRGGPGRGGAHRLVPGAGPGLVP